MNVPVICMVENMSKFICGKCGNSSEIFPRSIQQNVIQTCDEMQLKLLVSIPIDQKVTRLLNLYILVCFSKSNFYLECILRV